MVPNRVFIKEGTADPSLLLVQHEESIVDQYRLLIREGVMFGRDRYVEVKELKINLPSPYDGTDDADQFNEWLISLLRYSE